MNTFDLENKFSLFCDENIYKKRDYEITKLTTKEDQERYGDKKLIRNGTIKYCDEKVASYIHKNMVIELIQCIENKSLGWWFSLCDCDYLVYGYYKNKNDELPEIVYLVKWKKLKKYIIKQCNENSSYVKAGYTSKNYGITFNIYYPWEVLIIDEIVDIIYK